MKKFYIIILALFISSLSFSQTVFVGGQCMTGTISLTYVQDIDGKPAYAGTGTVAGIPGIEVSVFWIGAPDNLWVIAFDGQPYFQNSCNTNIPPGTSPNLACSWVPVPATNCTGASPISVSGAVVLPVGFTSFTATAAGTAVALRWTTSQETNNRGFTVQRSANGQQWTDLGFVAGAGNASAPTSYFYTDSHAGNGINFYRLQQQDIDGRTSFSAIVTATINNSTFFTISDNPGKGIYKLNMASAAGELQLMIRDAGGRVILNKQATVGNQVIDISQQAPGVYWLMVKKGALQTGLKLIKL